MKLGIITAALLLVVGTMFAAAQPGGRDPTSHVETGKAEGNESVKTGAAKKGAVPKSSEKNKQPGGRDPTSHVETGKAEGNESVK